MHWMGILIYLVIALWLLPGAIWRPVALILLGGWFLGEVGFLNTGQYVFPILYLACDLAVVGAVLFARSHWSDWLILAPYPVVWWLYTLPVTQGQWEALYWIVLAQFIVAGPWPNIVRARGAYTHGPLRPIVGGIQNEGA